MKINYFTLLFILLMNTCSFGQDIKTTIPTFFIQSMISLDSQEQTTDLEKKLRENPNVKICRIDFNTKTLFIITQNIDNVSSEIFNSWLKDYFSKVACVQIGVHGVDKLNNYPLTNCK